MESSLDTALDGIFANLMIELVRPTIATDLSISTVK